MYSSSASSSCQLTVHPSFGCYCSRCAVACYHDCDLLDVHLVHALHPYAHRVPGEVAVHANCDGELQGAQEVQSRGMVEQADNEGLECLGGMVARSQRLVAAKKHHMDEPGHFHGMSQSLQHHGNPREVYLAGLDHSNGVVPVEELDDRSDKQQLHRAGQGRTQTAADIGPGGSVEEQHSLDDNSSMRSEREHAYEPVVHVQGPTGLVDGDHSHSREDRRLHRQNSAAGRAVHRNHTWVASASLGSYPFHQSNCVLLLHDRVLRLAHDHLSLLSRDDRRRYYQ